MADRIGGTAAQQTGKRSKGNFNLTLDDDTRAALNELAAEEHKRSLYPASRSEIIRRAILQLHQRTFTGK